MQPLNDLKCSRCKSTGTHSNSLSLLYRLHPCVRQVGEDGTLLAVARQVQAEVAAALRIVCKHGNILVLPTLPSPPPSAQ